MNIRTEGNTLALGGRFDGRSTAEVRAQLRLLAEHHRDIAVDLSEVDSVDVNALTLLAATSKTLELQGRRLVVRGCRPALRRIIAYTRVRSVLVLEQEPATA